jgi:hypothetical protein
VGRGNEVAIFLDRDALKQAVQLKLELRELHITSFLIDHEEDAAEIARKDIKKLKSFLKEAFE